MRRKIRIKVGKPTKREAYTPDFQLLMSEYKKTKKIRFLQHSLLLGIALLLLLCAIVMTIYRSSNP